MNFVIIKKQNIGTETISIVKENKEYKVVSNNFSIFKTNKISKAFKRFRGEVRMTSQAEAYSYEQYLSNYTF